MQMKIKEKTFNDISDTDMSYKQHKVTKNTKNDHTKYKIYKIFKNWHV